MKALRRLTLAALFLMSLIQLYVIEGVRSQMRANKPSALIFYNDCWGDGSGKLPKCGADPVFHEQAIRVETLTVGGEKYEQRFLDQCPAGRNCI